MQSARVTTFITALFALLINAFAQDADNRIFFAGNIYSIDSLDHLPFVVISVNGNRRFVSDANGHFVINTLGSDTIDFSCTGYESVRILMGEDKIIIDTVYVEVLMRPKIYDMRAADILPFSSYEEFRSALVHHEVDPLADIARKNVNIIMIQNKQNIGPAMDACSNYRNLMKMKDENNNAFIFLSSEPGKGIFAALSALGIKLPW